MTDRVLVNAAVRNVSHTAFNTENNRGGGTRLNLTADVVNVEGTLQLPAAPVTIFLEATGSDANAGRTPAQAVASLTRALQLAETYATARIQVGAGTFDFGATTAMRAPDVALLGTNTVTVETIDMMGGGVVTGSRTLYTVASSSSPLAADALVGQFLLQSGGSNYAPIVANTATTITTVGRLSGVTGFSVVTPATTFTWPFFLVANRRNGSLSVRSARFQFPSAFGLGVLSTVPGSLELEGVILTGTTGSQVTVERACLLDVEGAILEDVRLAAAAGSTVSTNRVTLTSTSGNIAQAGVTWRLQETEIDLGGSPSSFDLGSGSGTLVQCAFLTDTNVQVTGGAFEMIDVTITALSGAALELSRGATVTLDTSAGASLTGGQGVDVQGGSQLITRGGTTNVTSTTSHALSFAQQSRWIHVGTVVIVSAADIGVLLSDHSVMTMDGGSALTLTSVTSDDLRIVEGSRAVVSSSSTLTPTGAGTVTLGASSTTVPALIATPGTVTDDLGAMTTGHRVFFRYTA